MENSMLYHKKRVDVAISKIAFWFSSTLGLPRDIFYEEINKSVTTYGDLILFIYNFERKYGKIYL